MAFLPSAWPLHRWSLSHIKLRVLGRQSVEGVLSFLWTGDRSTRPVSSCAHDIEHTPSQYHFFQSWHEVAQGRGLMEERRRARLRTCLWSWPIFSLECLRRPDCAARLGTSALEDRSRVLTWCTKHSVTFQYASSTTTSRTPDPSRIQLRDRELQGTAPYLNFAHSGTRP